MPQSNFGRFCRQLDEWNPYPGAMLVHVDIRHMRSINQWASPGTGDQVIAGTLAVMADWAGPHGLATRLWSNEFVAAKAIDHGQMAMDECHALRDRLCAIRFPSLLGEGELSVSIGLISTGAARGDWRQRLMQAADACLEAKRRGINQIVRGGATAPEQSGTHRDPAAVLNFRRLRSEMRLTLHPQPVMDIRGSNPRLAKAEFLLRMEENGRFKPLPAGTIETLEYFGLTPELDAFTAQTVLAWIDEHPDLVARLDGLTINLSARSVADARFMQRLFSDVRAVHPPSGKLGFEITETAAIEQLDVAADIIQDFRTIGCSFSLDDFGSGLCSFGYLHSLPVSEVKIDGRFIRQVADDPLSQEIVRAIRQVAHAAGKKTVAEFVDDPRKLMMLKALGVDYAQGFLFYPAISTEQLAALLLPAAATA
ncbi:EAL domain-containing protein [Solimonas soli]|uniref:EAL domain-containing protein n=1 Tax=Solimonas soli TaxID=413479 RepID=UPI0004AFA11D|nr:bifunctional diguanylate cyclase/phosphodiesterase [Solimonas soli]